ncbi:MAG: L,D-transpeptidase family protein [Eubacteriales bacterium]|nr:L,D-transpeptidase family protein [Eubacteriales bacterium]
MTKKKLLKALFLTALITAGSAFTAFADDSTYITGSKINGYQVGGMTPEEAMQSVSSGSTNYYTLTIKEKGGAEEQIGYQDIDLGTSFSIEAFQEVLDAQNANGRVFGSTVPLNTEIAGTPTYNQEKLEERMNSLSCISQQTKTENARISAYQEGQPFTVLPEVDGNSLDTEHAKAAIRQAINDRTKELDLNAIGVYDEITLRQDDAGLNALAAKMNEIVNISITYSIRGASEVLPGSTIVTWLTGTDANGQIAVNQESVLAYVNGLKAKYDTAGTYRTFTGGSGAQVGLKTVYGWRIDAAGEAAALTAAIQSAQSQTREPVWAKKGNSATMPEWGNTFVEVDMARQHVYFFKDGTVVWDAPCVTGNVSKDYTTPDGVYSIYSKERNRVLRGKLVNGKPEYETPVSYWMPFNGGIGLHDANWRSNFGGSIYKTSGSHGCVNLPPAKAAALYDLISVGTIVVCHN